MEAVSKELDLVENKLIIENCCITRDEEKIRITPKPSVYTTFEDFVKGAEFENNLWHLKGKNISFELCLDVYESTPF